MEQEAERSVSICAAPLKDLHFVINKEIFLNTEPNEHIIEKK